MSSALLFWILMLFGLVGGVYARRYVPSVPVLAWAPDIILFLLLLILGWHAFGAPIRF